MYLSDIEKRLTPDLQTGDFARAFLVLFTDKKFFATRGSKSNPAFNFVGNYDKAIEEVNNTYEEKDEKTPAETQEYFQVYGFDKLVASVSRWINHDGITEREYNIDRLWIGRYIDFLDKAKEYVAWLKSDQAIAKKRIADIRKQSKKTTNNG